MTKMKLLGLAILMASVCAGQQRYCAGGNPPKDDPGCIPVLSALSVTATGTVAQPAPVLKCGKYQHVTEIQNCVWASTDGSHGQCYRCEDDLHVLTEREWQNLVARLKALEQKTK